MPCTDTVLRVPGARLHYQVRGDGPLVLLVGSPMPAAEFAPLAHALAGERTVVTHDPRGHAGSRLDDPDSPSTPDIRADDVAAVLDALGVESADVFGSSGGAVTGLALAARYPGRVRTLVAHEPPLLELLPDAPAQRAATDEIVATYRRDGAGAAWAHFMRNAGFDLPADAQPPAPTDEQQAEAARFFEHDLVSTTRYRPDAAALRASGTRIVIGLGVGSGALITASTSRAAARFLGAELVEFPGDHGGFLGAPGEFAAALQAALGVP
jgi:pimeloyl-ACP methyl ester carboxylesterase